MSTNKIAIIICSARNPRVGVPITNLIHKSITSTTIKTLSLPQLEILDLKDHLLPWHDEPGVPMHIESADGYEHEHTKAWSRTISAYSGFIFVTPQYNWGIPGVLKNNMDYLFNEWKGKPALIVSYGGRGGGKAAANLRTVLGGLRMVALEEHVELSMGKVEGAGGMSSRGELHPELAGAWVEELGKTAELFEKLADKVNSSGT